MSNPATAAAWQPHVGLDYAVVMLPGQCADNASIHVNHDDPATRDALLTQIAALPQLVEALKDADALIESLWKSVDWGKTFGLDAMALNEVPPRIKRAILAAGGVPK